MNTRPHHTLPQGFFPLFFVLALTAACFALVQSLLVLYCTNHLHFSDSRAYALYAAFVSIIFATPLLTGLVAGRHLGYPKTIMLGLLLATIGLYVICIGSPFFLYVGLGAFAVGLGSAIAATYVLMGRSFEQQDYRRVSGFTLSYSGMNIGALLALIGSGFVVVSWGYQSTFMVSAVIMLIALLIFTLNMRHYLYHELRYQQQHPNGTRPEHPLLGAVALVVCVPAVCLIFYFATYSDFALLLAACIALIALIAMAWRLDTVQRKKILAVLTLIILGLGFWALYMLAPSLLTLFILRNVEREVMGVTIPPSEFISLNPLFIIILGFALSALWLWLDKHKRAPSLPLKFVLGVSLMGCAYLVLALGIHCANNTGLTAPGWIILSYLLQAAGELLIAPISIAMIGVLTPKRYEGLIMGVWLLSVGVGGTLSGYLAEMTTTPQHLINPLLTNALYAKTFIRFGVTSLLIASLALLLTPYLKRWIR